MAGNPCTDFSIDGNPAMIPTVYGFHLIPKSLYDEFTENQCFYSIQLVIPH